MRALLIVTPTPEQLSIISRTRPGTEIIRGAAGSGKTTTAILRLRSLIGYFDNRRKREGTREPVRILVLTFNRTLRGYIEALARSQAPRRAGVLIEISTFASWARTALGNPPIADNSMRRNSIKALGSGLTLESRFLLDEVDYVTGRFTPEQLANYLTARREGRGISPRVERSLRQRIINEVINPYEEWKRTLGLLDWNDLAVGLANQHLRYPYDIIIVDETQDFSANQLRAINNNLAEVHSLTLVVDTAQRIYARGFTWQEAGITVRPENIRRLRRNYRNTIEIAQFAAPLIEDIPFDDDATIPDFSSCVEHGQTPIVLKGRFAPQTNYVIRYIQERINLDEESVAILHPLGGGWFNFIKSEFDRAGLRYAEITRESEWPEGDENIAFSTLHSSKGLEFDHVIIIGLNSDVTPHGEEEGDDRLITLRRLLSMGIGRARRSIILGHKPEEASDLIDYLDPSTYQELKV